MALVVQSAQIALRGRQVVLSDEALLLHVSRATM